MDAETKDTVSYKDKNYVFKPEYKANEIAAYLLNGQMSYPTCLHGRTIQSYRTGSRLHDRETVTHCVEILWRRYLQDQKWEDYLKENFKE